MSSLPRATFSADCADRLRRILSSVHLECACQSTLHGALQRFSDLECRRRLRSALAEARRRREWIAAQLEFLAEIDEITESEPDESVFDEVAALFDEVGTAARSAAQSLREARAAR